jgi:hypothetical protein
MTSPDPADNPPPGRACPWCGGGPAVPVPNLAAYVCKSCARVVARIRTAQP